MLRFRLPSVASKRIVTSSTVTATVASSSISSQRTFIIPQQLKAYGDAFIPSDRELSKTTLLPQNELNSIKKLTLHGKALFTSTMQLAENIDSFDDMNLPTQIQSALAELGVTVPSPVQQQAIPALLAASNSPAAQGTQSLVIAAPHGTGKTFAYLAPLFARLMKDRDVYKIPLREHRPRAIIFAPTRELIWQIQGVCKTFEKHTGLKSVAFTSTKRNHRKWKKMMANTMPDIVVMGPSFALRLIENHRLFLDDLRSVVLDEADELISETSSKLGQRFLVRVIRRLCYKHLWPVNTQTVFVTSAFTAELGAYVRNRHGRALPAVISQGMHLPSRTSHHKFISVPTDNYKLDVLRRVLNRGGWTPKDVDGLFGNSIVLEEGEDNGSSNKNNDEWEKFLLPDHHQQQKKQLGNENLPAVVNFKTNNNNYNNKQEQQENQKLTPEQLEEQKLEQEDVDSFDYFVRSEKYTSSSSSSYQNNSINLPPIIRWEHLETRPAPFLNPHTKQQQNGGVVGEVLAAPDQRRCIIFFKNIDKCTALYWRLKGLGYNVTLMHASLPGEVRDANYKKWSTGEVQILCATDLCSRGIDVDVSCVVNYDMPIHAKPYLNRAGRAARMGRQGAVVSLYTNKQKVIVSAIKQLLRSDIPLEGLSNYFAHMQKPNYAQFRRLRRNRLAKKYVSLITRRTIPAHLEKTYVKHNAMWRPLFHPETAEIHGGVPVRQQKKITARIREHAMWHRRIKLAHNKGGSAKFGSKTGGHLRYGSHKSHGGIPMLQSGDDPQLTISKYGNNPGQYDGSYAGIPQEPPK